MRLLLLDTNVLIGRIHPPGDTEAAVCSLSYAELRAGVVVAADPIERAVRQAQFQRAYEFFGPGIPFDDRAAESYALVLTVVREAGRTSAQRTTDLMIAATAHANGAGVFTRNVRDFAGLERLVPIVSA